MRVQVGGSIPELRHLAVTQIEYVRVVDLDAPAAPAGRADHQRDTVLVGEDRLKDKMDRNPQARWGVKQPT